MTVEFLDAPGKVLDKTEALDFTASTSVIAISVSFGPLRSEERVYRDGVFLHPYLRSTKTDNTYSLVRDGGWPDKVPRTLYVDEVPVPEAPVGSGSAWTVLYDKDLRTLPNQTIAAPIVYNHVNFTADGQPWCFTASGGGLSIVNGQGMVGVANTDVYVPNNLSGGMYACMKVYQMAGYDPAQETAVQVRFTGIIQSNLCVGACAWGNADERTGTPQTNTAIMRWYGPISNYFSSRYDVQGQYVAGSLDTRQYDGSAYEYEALVLAVSAKPWSGQYPVSGNGKTNYHGGFFQRLESWVADWPSMESMQAGGGSVAADTGTQSAIKAGWYLGSTANGSNRTATATHIRILQRPVT